MAVLPFDAVPADSTNSPFAEGVAEEIHDQLGHNPKLRLVGRTSAEVFRNSDADAPTIGKKLHVSYLLDGTVRRAGNQVKVAVALLRARDGIELWRHSYSGKLDDIFAIQQSIGQQVEGQLRAQFVGPKGVTPSTLATSGEVYGYYLTARGLTRYFEAARVETAIDLLHRALKLDPNYAPAWAQLAIATRYRGYLQGKLADEDAERVREQAIGMADKATALSPQLAEAHLAKAIALEALDDTGDEGKSELLIAARLDPNNADTWAELAQVYQWAGYFPEELAAQRRRVQIDPLWSPGLFHAAELAWQLGYEGESWNYVRQVERDSPGSADAHLLRADAAYRSGNLSGALKEALIARKVGDAVDRRFANREIAQALRAAGFLDRARPLWHFEVDDRLWALWKGEALPGPTINQIYRNARVAWANQMVTFAVLKTLVAAGRSPEAVALYHRRFSSAEEMIRYPSGHLGLLEDGSTVALALSDSGQKDAALHLLKLLRREADYRIARGAVPRNYHYYYAMILAVSGDNEGALRSLEESARRGWHYAEEKSLPDLAMEPAFRALLHDKRFQRILTQQRAWQEQERARITPLLSQVGQT
jgi:TolB-like protein